MTAGLHGQERLRRLSTLRCAAEHLETAGFLERRAERAATPALAALLRERAAERRRRGERLLAGLRGEAVQVERL